MQNRLVEKVLVAIIVFLVFIIAVTTALVFRDRQPEPTNGAVSNGEAVEQSFTGIGRVAGGSEGRAGGDGATVIIRVVFPYDASDTVFTEEMAKSIGFFRETIRGYFAAMTAADPRLHDETTMKAELLERFNTRLRLGNIERLFFSEFLIID
jgi:flagellar basal body-associated protein FliL